MAAFARNPKTGERLQLVDNQWVPVKQVLDEEPRLGDDLDPRAQALLGLGETGLAMATGAVATPVAGLAGMLAAPFIGSDAAADRVRGIQEGLTYNPSSRAAEQISGMVAKPFELLAEGADAVGDFTLRHTGSPLLATGARTLIEGAPDLLGLKGMRGLKGRPTPAPHANPDVNLLRSEGVNVSRGRAGSKVAESVNRAGDALFGPTKYEEAVGPQFNEAVLRRAGLKGNKVDDGALDQLHSEVESSYKDLTGRVNTKFDQTLLEELGDIEKAAVAEMGAEASGIKSMVSDLLASADDGVINGTVAQAMRSRSSRLSGGMNPSQRYFAGQIKEALDDAFERSASKPDAEAMATTRDRFRTLEQLKDAMRNNASGDISPSRLYNVLDKKKNRSAETLRDLARAGKNVLPDKLGNSGTTTRGADIGKIVHGITNPLATVGSLGTVNLARRIAQDPTSLMARPAAQGAGVAAAVSGSGEAMLAEQRKRIDAYLRAIGAR